jgi:hypothetical protein
MTSHEISSASEDFNYVQVPDQCEPFNCCSIPCTAALHLTNYPSSIQVHGMALVLLGGQRKRGTRQRRWSLTKCFTHSNRVLLFTSLFAFAVSSLIIVHFHSTRSSPCESLDTHQRGCIVEACCFYPDQQQHYPDLLAT